MKKLSLCLALFGLLGLGGQAFAVIGTIDDVPAATLLLPYFEVDIEDPVRGVNTLFSINNASATAILAHVTVWSDQSIPVLDFDVYLTGFDVQTISLRDIFINGNLPVTASVGQDPDDDISPQGPASQDINFASCSTLPYPPGFVSASFRSHLQAWLQGLPSTAPGLTNQCAGSKTQDGILRGYITVDTVNACNLFFPSDWALYQPFITNQNVLWGDYFYVNNAENFAQGETLVHIEACPAEALTSATGPVIGPIPPGTPCFAPGDHTFYGRYNGADASDGREPLPTTTAARFLNGGDFDGGTDFLIWREANAADTSYACTNFGPPSWFPLEAVQIVIFDEQEQPVTADDCPSGDPTCEQEVVIPNEANRTDVALDLLAPFDFGWAYLNLQHNNPGFVAIYGDTFAQSWTTAVMDAEGRFSVGLDAIQLDNAGGPLTVTTTGPNTFIIPVP
jgi:hypothetical protein